MPTSITTGAARIVWGNPLTSRAKTDQNNKPVFDDQGKPIMQWSFGIAIPKAEFGPLWQAMNAEAATLYPQGVPQNYAWKFKDGDGFDDQGKPFASREGYAGHYVLSVSTESFAPRVVRLNGGAYSDMTEGVKTGDYVRVALNLKAHSGKPGTRGSVPGLYINPVMIEFIGYGTAIQNGPDAMTVFGGQSVALPPGASAVPLAPQGVMPGTPPANPMQPGQHQQAMPLPGTFTAPVTGAVPPAMPHAAPAPQAMTASPSNMPGVPQGQPHHAFVQNAAPGIGTPPAFAPMPGQPQVR